MRSREDHFTWRAKFLQGNDMKFNFDEIIARRGTDSVKWELYPKDVLPMWVADMDFRVPEPIVQALHKAVDHAVFGYNWDSEALRQSVVDRMDRLYGWKVERTSVVTITGLVSGFVAAANALCKPGEGYIIQPPVYMPFNSVQDMTGAYRQENQLLEKLEGRVLNYEIDWEGFDHVFHSEGRRSKMFLLCNPHNPAGAQWSRDDLEKMANKCISEETIIVSDEIHSELLLGATPHVPIATISPEIENNTITLISPSKTFNLAGLFCGFAIIPNPELRKKFKQAIGNMTLHVTSLSFPATLSAFSGECDPWLEELKSYLRANRDETVRFIDRELPDTIYTIPHATYLEWIGFQKYLADGRMNSDPAKWLLDNAKLALNDGASFGAGGQPYARLNFATSRATLLDGLERMAKALR